MEFGEGRNEGGGGATVVGALLFVVQRGGAEGEGEVQARVVATILCRQAIDARGDTGVGDEVPRGLRPRWRETHRLAILLEDRFWVDNFKT